MKKLSPLDSIEVKSPCAQDWDSMHGSNDFRFCDHCVKHVHDLSAMTRKDARKLIARSNGNICVRYVRRPDGRIETLKHRLHQITRQAGIAAGVLGTSLTVSTLAYAQSAEPAAPQENPPAAELTIKENGSSGGTISGVITDQNGAVITFAIVTIFNETGSVYQSAPTNAEGCYEFTNLPEGRYKLKVEAGGFDSKDAGDVLISTEAIGKQDVQLSVAKMQQTVQVGSDRLGNNEALIGSVSCTIGTVLEVKNKLIRAVQIEDADEVKNLIGMGKKVNVKNIAEDGNFPLHYAVENGNMEILELLLNAGAKTSVKNYDKRTPLMMIDEDATADIVNLLLRYGSAINAVDKDKNTALIIAAGNVTEDVLRALILSGADINAQNKKGRTALMNAADEGSLESVKILLENGADVNLKDRKGATAWNMTGAEDIKQVLLSYGAVAGNN
jgi:hypothetical protein